MIVEVYRNLTKDCYSVRDRSGVLFHTEKIVLKNATFVVRENGRQRVLDTGHKNVHAFVKGEIDNLKNIKNKNIKKKIYYNPRDTSYFYEIVDGKKVPVVKAKQVTLSSKGVFKHEV